jgi:hypothetical protein
MAEKKFLTIHFTDGTKMSVDFPKQDEFAYQVVKKIKDALDASQLAIEVGNELFVIPMNSIKYLQMSPAPKKLPDIVIRDATLKIDY